VVIGAGLAGLATAYELARSGHRVTVLEAQQRAGGRVHTIRDVFADGLYAEAGAVFIPEAHVLTMTYARDVFHLPLAALSPSASKSLDYLRGTRITDPNTATNWPVELTPKERGGVETLWRAYIIPALSKIGDPRAPGWPGPDLASYDNVTFAAFLAAQGASPGALAILRLGYFDLWGEGFDSYSALMLLRDLGLAFAPPPHLALPFVHHHLVLADGTKKTTGQAYSVAGGNWQLPRAFAESPQLRDRIVYGAPVVRVERKSDRVEVVCDTQEGQRRFSAHRVVCAAPFSVARDITFAPALSAGKQRAVRELPYTSATRVYVQAKRRFWDARKLPGIGNTDLPAMWVHDATATQQATRGILESYTAGARARAVAALDEEARYRCTRDDLRRVYDPVDEGALAIGSSWAWDDDRWARGGYCWFKPGQLSGLYQDILRPDGPIHFAGDHASPLPGWMEGALESAYRVVKEVNAAKAPT
jgi:monoamine oxidase